MIGFVMMFLIHVPWKLAICSAENPAWDVEQRPACHPTGFNSMASLISPQQVVTVQGNTWGTQTKPEDVSRPKN